MNNANFWILLSSPISITIIGVIISLLLEYFLIKPYTERHQKLPKNTTGELPTEKKSKLSSLLEGFKSRIIWLFGKFINLFRKLDPKVVYRSLFVFSLGIVFTIFSAQVTGTDISKVDLLFSHPTSTPYIYVTSTPKVQLLRTNPTVYSEVLFVIDISNDNNLANTKDFLRDFVGKLLPKDRIGLVTYDKSEVKTVFPLTEINKSGDEIFLVKLSSIDYAPGDWQVPPLLYDAIVYSIGNTNFQRSKYKSVIIFVSTGSVNDESSTAKYKAEDAAQLIENRAAVGDIIIPVSLWYSDVDTSKMIADAAGTELYEWRNYDDSVWVTELINKYLK